MLLIQRREKIKELLLEKKSVTAQELAQLFGVTNETIRRDLMALEESGVISRVHGGAYIEGGTTNEIDISLRRITHTTQKQQIATLCSEIIQNGDSIFLDSSTTAYFVAQQIMDYRLTVLTNSFKVIELLSASPSIKLLSVGGNFDRHHLSFFGTKAIDYITTYHVDKAFFSCRSANFRFGIMDSNEKTAEIRKKVVEQSSQSYLCIDSSKFGATSFVNICDFKDLTGIVTDKLPSAEWAGFLQQERITVYDYSSQVDLPESSEPEA